MLVLSKSILFSLVILVFSIPSYSADYTIYTYKILYPDRHPWKIEYITKDFSSCSGQFRFVFEDYDKKKNLIVDDCRIYEVEKNNPAPSKKIYVGEFNRLGEECLEIFWEKNQYWKDGEILYYRWYGPKGYYTGIKNKGDCK